MEHKNNKHTYREKDILRASLADIHALIRAANIVELSHGARKRLRWFEYALEHQGNVSLTCRYFGIARSTFLRWAKRFDPNDHSTLEEKSRRPKTMRQPETDERIIALIRDYRHASPTLGKEHIKKKLLIDHGIEVSASTVGRVIHRHAFFFADTNAHRQKRLNATLCHDTRHTEEGVLHEERQVVREHVSELIESTHTLLTDTAALSDAALPESAHEPIESDGLPLHYSNRKTGGAGGASLACLFLIIGTSIFGGFFGAVDSVKAAESASFRLYDEFPNYSERHQRSSTSFTLNEDGITWESKPLASASFHIVTAPPVSVAETTPPTDTPSPGPGPSGGRRPCPLTGVMGPCPEYVPPIPEPQPEPSPPVEVIPPVTPPSFEVAHPAAPQQIAFVPPEIPMGGPQVTFFGSADDVCPSCPACELSIDQCPHAAAPDPGFRWPSLLLFFLGLLFGTFIVPLLTLTRRFWSERGYGNGFFVLPLVGIFGRENNEEEKEDVPSPRSRRTKWISRFVLAIFIALLIFFWLWGAVQAFAATTVPLTHVYNGHLLDSSGNAVTTAHTVRFSYWTSADFVSGDITATGAINVGAVTYSGWNEEHTVTPDSKGYFSVQLGSVTAVPDIAALSTDLFLQVEVKTSAAAATSYELLDVNAGDASIDRSPVLSVQFAFNADKLDLRDTGTASGSIPVLQAGGLLPISTIPEGTTQSGFTLDTDGSVSGDLTLTFGGSIKKTLSYSQTSNYFNFNDDVNIQGDLTISGLINGIDISTLVDTATGALKVSSGAGLNASIAGGSYRISGNLTNFAGDSTVSVTNNATNYVYFSSTGTQVNTSGFPSNISIIPLAEVITSGGGVTQVRDRRALSTDDRERTLVKTYHAGFEGASYQGDASDNVGQLYTDHDNTNNRNFYRWSSSLGSLQDYDIVLRTTLPEDFVRWNTGSGNHLRVTYRTTSASTDDNQLDISVFDTNGSPVTLSGSSLTSGVNLASTSWATEKIEWSGSPTWTAGQDFLIKLKVHARNNYQMHIGDLMLHYTELPSE